MKSGFPYTVMLPYNKGRDQAPNITDWFKARGLIYNKDVQAYASSPLFYLKEDLIEVDITGTSMLIVGFADLDVCTEFKLTWC